MTKEMKEYFYQLKPQVETMLGQTFSQFELISYSSQVVAGTIYWALIRHEDGNNGYLHAKVFAPLPHLYLAPKVLAAYLNQTSESPFKE